MKLVNFTGWTALALGLGLACACATAVPDVSALSVKDQMKDIVDSASSTVFAVGADVDPDNPDAPAGGASAGRWKEALDAATQLNAVAVAMQDGAHARDQGDWQTFAKQMADLSQTAMTAAGAKDRASFYAASNNLSDNCAACHTEYKNQAG